jgi:hypothetical protein
VDVGGSIDLQAVEMNMSALSPRPTIFQAVFALSKSALQHCPILREIRGLALNRKSCVMVDHPLVGRMASEVQAGEENIGAVLVPFLIALSKLPSWLNVI